MAHEKRWLKKLRAPKAPPPPSPRPLKPFKPVADGRVSSRGRIAHFDGWVGSHDSY